MAKAAKKQTFADSAKNANQFKTALAKFTASLEERRELWQRLTPEQRERLVTADPVLTTANALHTELQGWFQ